MANPKNTPKIEVVTLDDVLPDPNNLNRHTQAGHRIVENSMRKRGVGRGTLAAGKNTEKPVMMAGNLTIEKARDAGIDEVILVHTTGNQIVVNVRDDLDPNSAEAIAMGIEDNESSKQSYNPDIDLLAQMTAQDGRLQQLMKEDQTFAQLAQNMQPYNLDPNGEWDGMPEFSNHPKAFKTIHIHFETEEDIEKFANKLEIETPEAKSVSLWYPAKERRDMKSQVFEGEE